MRQINRHRGLCVALVLAGLTFAPATHVDAQSNPFGQAPRALATRFADGRTTYHLLKPEGTAGWTGLFPRIADAATDRNGLPLVAFDFAVVMDGQNAKVGVTLIYGNPHQHRIAVATVSVTPQASVTVDQLTAFGVKPVAFTIVPVPSSSLEPPKVSSASASLDVRVELARPDGPTFRIVVVNQSSQAVRGFRIEGERAGRKFTTGYRRAPRQAMLIQPGGALAIEVPTSVIQGLGGTTRVAADHVALSSVTWEDGTVEGDKRPAASEYAVAAGYARQLATVLTLLRDAGDSLRPQALTELRGRIAALSIEVTRADVGDVHKALPAPDLMTVDLVERSLRTGMQQVRELVLKDLDAFVVEPARGATAEWLSKTTAAYEEWLARAEKFRIQ